jgi:hypothetical protein
VRLGEAVQLAEKGWAVICRTFAQVLDESFDLLSAGIVKSGSSTIIGGVGFHQSGIELMLSNQQAEAVAETRRGGMAVAVCSRSGGSIPAGLSGWYFRRPAELLDGAETNAIGFSKRSIDRTGLGDAHFGPANEP